MKLGRKAARGLGLGGSAATIYSHSQERRDLFVLDHAADSRWARALFNSVERLSSRTGELSELFSAFYIKFRYLDSEHTPLPAAVERSRAIIVDMNLKQLIPLFAAAVFFLAEPLLPFETFTPFRDFLGWRSMCGWTANGILRPCRVLP